MLVTGKTGNYRHIDMNGSRGGRGSMRRYVIYKEE